MRFFFGANQRGLNEFILCYFLALLILVSFFSPSMAQNGAKLSLHTEIKDGVRQVVSITNVGSADITVLGVMQNNKMNNKNCNAIVYRNSEGVKFLASDAYVYVMSQFTKGLTTFERDSTGLVLTTGDVARVEGIQCGAAVIVQVIADGGNFEWNLAE